MKTLALIAIAGAASSASAQDLCITVAPGANAGDWDITAEFLGNAPAAIAQVWADASFAISGDGSDITFTSYNGSYDTSLGNAVIVNGANASFTGNANSFFGTPDASNPLAVASFTYAGDAGALSMDLTGQNSALFDDGSAFGIVELYQTAQGDAGSLSFEIKIVPAPATAALLGLGGLAAVRRRR